MKSIKTFGLAAILMLTAIAAIGVSSASANEETVLCKAVVAECANENYIGHAFKTGTLPTTFKLSEGATVKCVSTMERNESEALTVLSFSSCSEGCTVKASGLPYSTDLHEPVEGNGKLSVNVAGLVFKCGSNECTYGSEKAIELPVTGGELAAIVVNQALPKNAGGALCPGSVQWEGEYKLKTSPTYVTKRGVSGPMFCSVNATPCPAASRVMEEAFSLAPKSEVVFGAFASGSQIRCSESSFSLANNNIYVPKGDWRYGSPTLSKCVGTLYSGCTLAWENPPYSGSLEAAGGGSGTIYVTETLGSPTLNVNCTYKGTNFTCIYKSASATSFPYKFTGGSPAVLSASATLSRVSGTLSLCPGPSITMSGEFQSAKSPRYLVSS